MGLEPKVVLRENTWLGNCINGIGPILEDLWRMIVAGLGIHILLLMSVKGDILGGTFWPLKTIDVPIRADVYLVHAPHNKLMPSEQRFVQKAQEMIAFDPVMT